MKNRDRDPPPKKKQTKNKNKNKKTMPPPEGRTVPTSADPRRGSPAFASRQGPCRGKGAVSGFPRRPGWCDFVGVACLMAFCRCRQLLRYPLAPGKIAIQHVLLCTTVILHMLL